MPDCKRVSFVARPSLAHRAGVNSPSQPEGVVGCTGAGGSTKGVGFSGRSPALYSCRR